MPPVEGQSLFHKWIVVIIKQMTFVRLGDKANRTELQLDEHTPWSTRLQAAQLGSTSLLILVKPLL